MKKDIIQRYDEMGGRIYEERYREEQQEKYRWANKFLEECQLTADIGCGTGLFQKTRGGGFVVGVDASAALLEWARQANQVGLLVRGDAEQLPLRDGVFQVVTCFTVLQNLEDPEVGLEEMARVTRPGGVLVVSWLKKRFQLSEVVKHIKSTDLKMLELCEDNNLKDWITLLSKSCKNS